MFVSALRTTTQADDQTFCNVDYISIFSLAIAESSIHVWILLSFSSCLSSSYSSLRNFLSMAALISFLRADHFTPDFLYFISVIPLNPYWAHHPLGTEVQDSQSDLDIVKLAWPLRDSIVFVLFQGGTANVNNS